MVQFDLAFEKKSWTADRRIFFLTLKRGGEVFEIKFPGRRRHFGNVCSGEKQRVLASYSKH